MFNEEIDEQTDMDDEDEFAKELPPDHWDRIYQRQEERGDLTPVISSLLELQSGDSVIELGCGPGYTVHRLAEELAPGTIFALDQHEGALRSLVSRAGHRREHIHVVIGDVTTLPFKLTEAVPLNLAFVLHHLDRPKRAIHAIAASSCTGTPLLVIEYSPSAPGAVGPRLQTRIPAGTIRKWLRDAGFMIEQEDTLPEEKYTILARYR